MPCSKCSSIHKCHCVCWMAVCIEQRNWTTYGINLSLCSINNTQIIPFNHHFMLYFKFVHNFLMINLSNLHILNWEMCLFQTTWKINVKLTGYQSYVENIKRKRNITSSFASLIDVLSYRIIRWHRNKNDGNWTKVVWMQTRPNVTRTMMMMTLSVTDGRSYWQYFS